MTDFRIETLTMPAAELGPENPLPPLGSGIDVHAKESPTGKTGDNRDPFAYGRLPNILPYTMQDGYTRELRPREFRVAVLENEILRATFLLEFGGRLWSLVHKPSGRELLEVNPVFQPTNLALRNAWVSGGVEWNIGTIGHCVFTCSPLFAARVMRDDGTPILRMYEWERIRQVPFQIDAYLPDGSPVLYVRVRIINPHDRGIPMYWWSNIAVPQTSDTRVVVPAELAYKFSYDRNDLDLVPIPIFGGIDTSYTTRLHHAMDFFYHIPEGRRPWIGALDGEGRGVIQTSTERLRGRKLFLWGTGPGGKRWQEFLSQLGHAYLEIQAGLARTQMEHLPMPAKTEWSWLEAYGLVEADPSVVHGSDWNAAGRVVEESLAKLIPCAELDAEFERGVEFVDKPPVELIQRGSGWGALELLRRETSGQPPFCSEGLVFDRDSLDDAQIPWISLLRDGKLPEYDPGDEPRGYMVQQEWRDLLEKAVNGADRENWAAWFHLGIMRYHADERDAAREDWERSLEVCRNPWALRNLAVLSREDGRPDDAAELYLRACRSRPSCLPIAIECGRTLLGANRAREWLDLLAELSETVRAAGRMRLLEARSALAVGDLQTVRRLFDKGFVIEDLREGERSLSDLWFAYHEKRISAEEDVSIDDSLRERVRRDFPVPPALDFRMSS